MRALFVGRGPFSQTLQKVFREVCVALRVPYIIEVAGKTDAKPALVAQHYDLAFFAVPPSAHLELLPLAWARKKPTWVEKPFGSSAFSAELLVQQWTQHGKPPCYVNFPHLRAPFMDLAREIAEGWALKESQVEFASAVVGGPGPDRTYMNGLWDWGAHAAAFAAFLKRAMGSSSDIRTPSWRGVGTRRWTSGTSPAFSFSTGNAFASKMVSYTAKGWVQDEQNKQVPFSLQWEMSGAGAAEVWSNGKKMDTLSAEQPLQKGMREFIEAVEEPKAHQLRQTFKHPNWDPVFAAGVTKQLSVFGPPTVPAL